VVSSTGSTTPLVIRLEISVSCSPLGSPSRVRWHLATGEAHDKAGAYGIQGAAVALVQRGDGSVTNVIGLPLAEALQLLAGAAEASLR